MRISCSARLALLGLVLSALVATSAAARGPIRPAPPATHPAKAVMFASAPMTAASLPASAYPWAQLDWSTAGVLTGLPSAAATSELQLDWPVAAVSLPRVIWSPSASPVEPSWAALGVEP
jgi:hypothetical protein